MQTNSSFNAEIFVPQAAMSRQTDSQHFFPGGASRLVLHCSPYQAHSRYAPRPLRLLGLNRDPNHRFDDDAVVIGAVTPPETEIEIPAAETCVDRRIG